MFYYAAFSTSPLFYTNQTKPNICKQIPTSVKWIFCTLHIHLKWLFCTHGQLLTWKTSPTLQITEAFQEKETFFPTEALHVNIQQ